MTKPNFSSILDRPATEIEKPKPLPVGTYLTRVVGLPRYDKSAKKGTDFIEFTHVLVSPGEDVDAEELSTYLSRKDGSTKSLSEITMKNTYYLTEDSAWRLHQFLFEHCGFDPDESTLRQAAESTANVEVYITVGHEPSMDGTSVFARIKGTAAAE